MGLYDRLVVEDEIDLPEFPADRRPSEIEWQTKDIGHPIRERYKLTADGRLLRHEQEYREKTATEKQAEAESHGFDSWEDYVAFCKSPRGRSEDWLSSVMTRRRNRLEPLDPEAIYAMSVGENSETSSRLLAVWRNPLEKPERQKQQ